MLSATNVRKGMLVKHEDRLCYVMNVSHHTPGNKRAIIQIKFRDLASGNSQEVRFGSGDKLEQAITDEVDMEYLYSEGENFVFMNQENFEQVHLHRDLLGGDAQWLKENMVCKITFFEGRVIAIQPPITVDLEVTETEPGLKGATVTNVYKPATLETGAIVSVPPFIEKGEKVRIDTRTGEYMERA